MMFSFFFGSFFVVVVPFQFHNVKKFIRFWNFNFMWCDFMRGCTLYFGSFAFLTYRRKKTDGNMNIETKERKKWNGIEMIGPSMAIRIEIIHILIVIFPVFMRYICNSISAIVWINVHNNNVENWKLQWRKL